MIALLIGVLIAGMTLDDLRASGRATITVPELAALLELGRDATYAAAGRGEIPGVLRIGRRMVVSVPRLLAWLGADPPANNNAPGANRGVGSAQTIVGGRPDGAGHVSV